MRPFWLSQHRRPPRHLRRQLQLTIQQLPTPHRPQGIRILCRSRSWVAQLRQLRHLRHLRRRRRRRRRLRHRLWPSRWPRL